MSDTTDLHGRRVLAIVTNYGVEQDELVVPLRDLREAGAHVDVAAVTADDIVTLIGDKTPGEVVRPNLTLDEASADSYGLLLIPGGTINADALRTSEAAVDLVKSFVDSRRAVAAICHGPWMLVEAGAVAGKKLTSYASLQTDVRNAGGDWVYQPVVRDDEGSWSLITSRTPDDLPDFLREIHRALVEFEVPEQPVF